MTIPQRDSFSRVTAGFYRDADPTVAADALVFALEASKFQKDETLLLMFARMAEVYPEVNPRFRQLLTSSLAPEGRQIIQALVDPPEQFKDARYLLTPISTPQDLDICWGEFLVTGSLDVVKRIIAVLDWPDLVRSCAFQPTSNCRNLRGSHSLSWESSSARRTTCVIRTSRFPETSIC